MKLWGSSEWVVSRHGNARPSAIVCHHGIPQWRPYDDLYSGLLLPSCVEERRHLDSRLKRRFVQRSPKLHEQKKISRAAQ
jgi:hypothetical protein